MERLLTVSECAELLAVSVSTLYKWIYEGRAPRHCKLAGGPAVRFRLEDVKEWAEGQVVPEGNFTGHQVPGLSR